MNECHFSVDRKYRYTLTHVWDEGPRLVVVGLNPSTADEQKLDPTLHKVKKFAQAWGFGSFTMLNLFAYRATHPRDMRAVEHPVGPANDEWIAHEAQGHATLVAWGNGGNYRDRDRAVMELLTELGVKTWCLRRTKQGQPEHPLYVPASVAKVPYHGRGSL